MEGLERLIGRSIGGKVTTSVEMERTTHSKSNARALAFSNVLVEANTCILPKSGPRSKDLFWFWNPLAGIRTLTVLKSFLMNIIK